MESSQTRDDKSHHNQYKTVTSHIMTEGHLMLVGSSLTPLSVMSTSPERHSMKCSRAASSPFDQDTGRVLYGSPHPERAASLS